MGLEQIKLIEFASTRIPRALRLSYKQIEELVSKEDEEALDELLDASSKKETGDDEGQVMNEEKEKSDKLTVLTEEEKEKSNKRPMPQHNKDADITPLAPTLQNQTPSSISTDLEPASFLHSEGTFTNV